jgi:exonuclease SbcC
MAKNYTNIKNSFHVLVQKIKEKGINESLLVIVGDIFESKSFLNTDDILVWKSICFLLRKENIKTLIIPGNHDYNINSELVKDNVSLLTDTYENIKCINRTSIIDGCIFGDSRLEFYIFSPIDKEIPKILEDINTPIKTLKIALLHEPINYASFDNGQLISNARFAAKDLIDYDLVLLGDIHLHQFLTDKIAYCGSFVQKTKGESMHKGYILWNLTTPENVGTFCPIPLKEVYIRIEAYNDKCELPIIDDNQKIRYSSFVYKDCSEVYIENLKLKLDKKYGYINQILNKTNLDIEYKVNDEYVTEVAIKDEDDHETIKQLSKSGGLNNLNTHEQIIRDILKDSPMVKDTQRIEEILTYHSGQLQNRNEINFTTYKINYLVWSNIFCYGENNYINFNTFNKNLVMLNGKNKGGKSSIIDIIIRILFNECTRGLKEDIVNKKRNHGHIKISFNIGEDEYIIEQTHYRLSKNQQHKIYKNGENITQDTIVKSYAFLRNTVGLGEYKNFVNMTTALQNRKFLVDMSQKDFIDLLTDITNIDILKDLEDETKKEISALKSANRKLLTDIESIEEVKEEEITQLETKQDTLINNRERLYNDISNINKKLIEISKDYNNTPIQPDLDDQIESITNIISIYNTKQNMQEYDGFDEQYYKSKLDSITKELWLVSKRLENIPIEVIKTVNNINYYDKIKINHITHFNDYNTLKSDISKKIKLLRDITHKPSDNSYFTDIINDTSNSKLDKLKEIVTTYKVEDLSLLEKCEIKQLISLNQEDNVDIILPDYTQIANDIHSLEKKIKKYYANYGSLKYSKDCEHCVSNKKNISSIFDIKYEAKKLDELRETLKQRENMELKFNKAKLYKYNKEQNEIFMRNTQSAQINELIKKRKIEYESSKARLKEYTNFSNWNLLQKLDKKLKLFKEHDIQKDYVMMQKLEKDKRYLEIQIEYKKLLELKQIKDANGSKTVRIEKLNQLEVRAKKNLDAVNTELKNFAEEYRIKKNNYVNRKMYLETYKNNIDNLEFYDLYFSVINCKTGIPSYILKQTCKIIEDQCNSILQSITDFTIKIVFDSTVRIYTVENDEHINGANGSGFQKFLLDLIFRITLTRISCISSPRLIFIDEGFGCLDKDSFISVASILKKIKNNFDSMFIISHIEELRSYVDISINIKKNENFSFVQHGTLTDEEQTIKLIQELNITNKRNMDFKSDVEKATEKTKTIKRQVKSKFDSENIASYIGSHGGLENILFEPSGAKLHCHGCGKDYVSKKGFIEKHLNSATNKKKHDIYILSLI